MNMQNVLKTIDAEPDYLWAWTNFVPIVLSVAHEIGAASLIEIGGGRSPTLTEDQVRALGCKFTSNDISSKELALGPAWAAKANFDIQAQDQSEVAALAGQFDLSYSKMVMEHVDNYRQAYQNISTLLKPGGVSIAFHPVLFSLPFLVNYLTPEAITKPVVERLYPRRNDNDIPKFPAFYHGCTVSESTRQSIEKCGFSQVRQIPFYGHGYYKRIPVAHKAQNLAAKLASKFDVTVLSSFCLTIAVK